MKSAEEMRRAFENAWGEVKRYYKSFYNIDENKKPRNIQELIEQKKNKKPFYKGDKKKPWE